MVLLPFDGSLVKNPTAATRCGEKQRLGSNYLVTTTIVCLVASCCAALHSHLVWYIRCHQNCSPDYYVPTESSLEVTKVNLSTTEKVLGEPLA